MKHKDGGEVEKEHKRGSSNFTLAAEKHIDCEIEVFTSYVKHLPQSIQYQLAPYLFELKNQHPNNQRLKQTFQLIFREEQQRFQFQSHSKNLVYTIGNLLQLSTLSTQLLKIADKIQSKKGKVILTKKLENAIKKHSFQKIEMLNPQYDAYFRMSKQERTHILPQHHIKPKQRQFYSEPRFLQRLEEMCHFQSDELYKGNILLLQYQGSSIKGKRVYSVTNHNSIQVWEREAKEPPQVDFAPVNLQNSNESELKTKQRVVINNNAKLDLTHRYIGHTAKVMAVSFSNDQFYMISGSLDRTIKLWGLREKSLLAEYKGHEKVIWDVDFSPSGYFFLSGSADGTMRLWKTDVPTVQRIYHHKQDVYKVKFANDPSFVISSGQDGTVKIWKTLEGQLFREIKFSKAVINFNLGFSGSYIAASEIDGRITILDAIKGEVVNTFYIDDPQSKKAKENQKKDNKEKEDKKQSKKMIIHDFCFSEDERQFTCIAAKHIVIYSMDRLEQKIAKNIFSIYDEKEDEKGTSKVAPKEVIYMGMDVNLTYCSYEHRNVLIVAGSKK